MGILPMGMSGLGTGRCGDPCSLPLYPGLLPFPVMPACVRRPQQRCTYVPIPSRGSHGMLRANPLEYLYLQGTCFHGHRGSFTLFLECRFGGYD